MDIDQLESELESWDIDPRNINLNDRAAYDGCFNIICRKDGKWEIFYGDRGQKTLYSIYDSEEQACLAFINLLRENKNTEKLADKPKYWKGYQRRASRFKFNFTAGLFFFGALFGMFWLGYQIYNREINGFFWFWLVWIIFFLITAFCYMNRRLYEKYEHIGEPVVYFILLLIVVFAAVMTPIVNLPEILASENPIEGIIGIAVLEPFLVLCIWGIYKLLLKEYVDELRKYIKSKKQDTDDEDEPSYDKEYDEEIKSKRKRSSIE